jgi:tetratricopeptide (TPR) repeat protein
VAALFALHPLHVESVAWISERKDVLSTFFGLLSIAVYYHYVKNSSFKYYILAIILLSLGLMAKPMLVTLPFVLLLLDFWPLKRFQLQSDFHLKPEKKYSDAIRRNIQIIIEKIPFFIPVVVSCIVTFFAQKSEGAVKAMWALPIKYRIANAVVSYVSYVIKAIWPHKLAVFYPHPGNNLPLWQIAGGTLLIVAACYWALRTAKKYPYILVGLFWYLGTLVPVIGLVQVGDQSMADRYTYIPLIGIFIIVSWGVSDLFKKRLRGQRSEISSSLSDPFNKRRFQKIFLGISAAILLVALSLGSFYQLNTWKNGITLFEHSVSMTQNNYQSENNLGTAYGSKNLEKALFHYKAALKIKPGYAAALYNMGNIYEKKDLTDEAIRYYLKALQINPDYFGALNNLGLIFYNQGDYDRAVLYFKRALKTESKKADARINLANVLFLQSKPEEAISQYQKILQIDSENADAHFNLAYVLSNQNKINEAVHHYNEALRIDPENAKAHYNLGNIYFNQENTAEAFRHYAETIKLNPDYVQAYNKLGLILFQQRKFNKAKTLFLKAMEIDPNYSEARKNLEILDRHSSTGEH